MSGTAARLIARGTVVFDCRAGNMRLRRYRRDAGFHLQCEWRTDECEITVLYRST